MAWQRLQKSKNYMENIMLLPQSLYFDVSPSEKWKCARCVKRKNLANHNIVPWGPKNVKSAEHSLCVRAALLAKFSLVSLNFRENKTLMGASEPHSRVHIYTVAAGWLLLLLFSFYFSYLLLLVMHRIRACPEWLMSFAATCHPVHGVNQVLIFQYTHTLGRSLAWMRLRRVFLLWADGCAPPTATGPIASNSSLQIWLIWWNFDYNSRIVNWMLTASCDVSIEQSWDWNLTFYPKFWEVYSRKFVIK